jgi:hypothetical protein
MKDTKSVIIAHDLKDLGNKINLMGQVLTVDHVKGLSDPSKQRVGFVVESDGEHGKNKDNPEFIAFVTKSGNELMESGEMEVVKSKFPELYKKKIQEIKDEVAGIKEWNQNRIAQKEETKNPDRDKNKAIFTQKLIID